MYRIYAFNTRYYDESKREYITAAENKLIYDSTIEDYKIGKGSITLETGKAGSFTFSLYPDHPFYDSFVRLKTIITVYKSGKIIFRGRILNDVTDYWNNKVFTCEGELSFLQDHIVRPYSFSGTPETFFKQIINEYNDRMDEYKRFKIGRVTVVDPNGYIARSNNGYDTALANLNSRLIEDSLGGYFYITHGEDGTEITPTINYLADFTHTATQKIEFGSNLKNYTKTVKAEEIATAIIPLGATVDDGNSETEDPKLTISEINGGKDYVYSEAGVSLYGWIYKTVSWDDVHEVEILKKKAEEYLQTVIEQNITLELTAIDLHLIDPTIESINIGDRVHVISKPHNFDAVLVCNKQTIDLLKPDSDTLTLGHTYSTFTESNSKLTSAMSQYVNIPKTVNSLSSKVVSMNNSVVNAEQKATEALNTSQNTSGDIEALAEKVNKNEQNIATNKTNIATNASDIDDIESEIIDLNRKVNTNSTNLSALQEDNSTHFSDIADLKEDVATNTENISKNATDIGTLTTSVSTNKTDITGLKNTVGTHTTKINNLTSSLEDKADKSYVDDAVANASSGDFSDSFPDGLPIANGGTGGTDRATAFGNLAYLGENPVSSVANDTIAKWRDIGSGHCFYNKSGCLNNQPQQYGTLLNIVRNGYAEVTQIWNGHVNSELYIRSGNDSGWGTSWKKMIDTTNILDLVYPIGSIYTYTPVDENQSSLPNPAEMFGGTWERIYYRFLYAQSDEYVLARSLSGESFHTLTENELPSHRHEGLDALSASQTVYAVDTTGSDSNGIGLKANTDNKTATYRSGVNTAYTGGGEAHNNMPPYLSVAMWRRIA